MPANSTPTPGDVDELLNEIRANLAARQPAGSGPVYYYPPGIEMTSAEDPGSSPGVSRAISNSEISSGAGQNISAGSEVLLAPLRNSFANLRKQSSALDVLPPSPESARAKVGRILVRLVHRIVWWQRRQWGIFAEAAEKFAQETTTALARLAGAHDFYGESLQSIGSKLASLEQQIAKVAMSLEQEVARRTGADQAISAVAGQLAALAPRLENGLYSLANMRAELSIQSGRLSQMAAQESGWPAGGEANLADSNHHLDPLYLAFADRFRGSRPEIKSRQKAYVPFLRAASAGCADRPVLDLGCGRGEWLELLRDNEMAGFGVDSNRAMLEVCRSLQLPAVEADSLVYLKTLPDNSIGAITSFHMVEHLPFAAVIELLDQGLRVLRPGGLLILETPNPNNVLVGSCNFYLDPTHRNPLPGAMLRFFVEARGFTNCRMLELCPHPALADFSLADSPAKEFATYFYGPQDYGLIAEKPSITG